MPGFTAKTRFDQGLRMSLEVIFNSPERQQPDPDFDRFCDRVAAIMQDAEAQIARL